MRALAASAALLAACAADVPAPTPAPAPAPAALTLTVERGEAEAMTLMEELAAGCWLDGVLGAANLLIDRDGKRLLFVGEDADMLRVSFGVLEPARSQIRLNGPAARDPATARRLARTLDLANATGETACGADG